MRTRIYRSICATIELTYKGAKLKRINVLKEDKVNFEGVRTEIQLYRKDLNPRFFHLVSTNNPFQNLMHSDINVLRSAQFIGWVIALGGLSNLSLVFLLYNLIWFAIGSGLLFVLGVSSLFFRYGSR